MENDTKLDHKLTYLTQSIKIKEKVHLLLIPNMDSLTLNQQKIAKQTNKERCMVYY